jgi:hypothetical protein
MCGWFMQLFMMLWCHSKLRAFLDVAATGPEALRATAVMRGEMFVLAIPLHAMSTKELSKSCQRNVVVAAFYADTAACSWVPVCWL